VSRPRIGELLVSAGVLSQEKLDEALRQPRAPGQRLGAFLVQNGLVSETQLTQILGQQLSVPWVSLYHIDFSRQLLNLVPREIAEKYCLVPIYVRRVRKQGETLYVAMDDPTNEAALAEVAQQAGLPAQPMIACPADIRSAIRVYYGSGDSLVATPPPSQHLAPIAHARSAPPPPLPARASQRPPQETPAPPIMAQSSASGDHPDAEPEIEAKEVEVTRRIPPGMIAMTMLDGTTLRLPGRSGGSKDSKDREDQPRSNEMTARDLVRALRGVALGKDPAQVGFEIPKWEELFATLLSVLLRKGLVADWEFIEELKRVQRRGESLKPKPTQAASPSPSTPPPATGTEPKR
jgi:type IV pilus assembly protein PilB